MPDFRVKMHQKSNSAGVAYSAPPDPVTGFGGLLLRGGEGGRERRGQEKKGGEDRVGEGKGRREERERGGRLLF